MKCLTTFLAYFLTTLLLFSDTGTPVNSLPFCVLIFLNGHVCGTVVIISQIVLNFNNALCLL